MHANEQICALTKKLHLHNLNNPTTSITTLYIHNTTSQPKLQTKKPRVINLYHDHGRYNHNSKPIRDRSYPHCRELPCSRESDHPSNRYFKDGTLTVDNQIFVVAAREFLLPVQRLRVRWNSQPSKIQTIPGNRRLSGHQELAVCQYLDRLNNIGLPARHFMITHYANAILRRSHPADSDDPQHK